MLGKCKLIEKYISIKMSTSFGFVRVKSLNKYLANVKNLNTKYDN